MRIITISAVYPPYHSGGYGIRIKNIMDGLSARGHDISVLTTKATSRKLDESIENTYPIFRYLNNRYQAKFFPKEVLFDIRDVFTIDKTIRKFKPDLIYLGHIYPLTKQLLPFLSTLKIPILCDEGGNSLKGAWTERGRWFSFSGDYQARFQWLNKLKPLVIQAVKILSGGRIKEGWSWPTKLSVIFNSKMNQSFVLGLGMPVLRSEVIYSGIDTEIFTFQARDELKRPLRIICPGRVEPRKGQLDAVRLLAFLKSQEIDANLLIVGKVMSHDYKQQILDEIEQNNLEENAKLLPMVSQEELAKLYHQADICFFPSYQDSGLSRIPMEAMACGSIVVSYGNEGSDEIIKNDVNGYCAEPGDIKKVTEIIKALEASSAKVQEISTTARSEIIETYTLTAYIAKIETFINNHFEN